MTEEEFIIKKSERLTSQEEKEIQDININEYPKFKKYYFKNIYYSTVKPQKIFMIKEKDKLIGTGKFLWRKIKINNKSLKMAAFGAIIDKDHQNKGLGTRLIKLQIKEAKKIKADFLFGSTLNPRASKILVKLKFKSLNLPIFYKEVNSNKIKKMNNKAYFLGLKKNILEKLVKEKKIFIGQGPI